MAAQCGCLRKLGIATSGEVPGLFARASCACSGVREEATVARKDPTFSWRLRPSCGERVETSGCCTFRGERRRLRRKSQHPSHQKGERPDICTSSPAARTHACARIQRFDTPGPRGGSTKSVAARRREGPAGREKATRRRLSEPEGRPKILPPPLLFRWRTDNSHNSAGAALNCFPTAVREGRRHALSPLTPTGFLPSAKCRGLSKCKHSIRRKKYACCRRCPQIPLLYRMLEGRGGGRAVLQ